MNEVCYLCGKKKAIAETNDYLANMQLCKSCYRGEWIPQQTRQEVIVAINSISEALTILFGHPERSVELVESVVKIWIVNQDT